MHRSGMVAVAKAVQRGMYWDYIYEYRYVTTPTSSFLEKPAVKNKPHGPTKVGTRGKQRKW